MPRDRKSRRPGSDHVPPGDWLEMPVTGMEAEFNVVLDEKDEIDPRKYWGSPEAFIDAHMLWRTRSSFQVPMGGAVYFDRGVIEVVTPIIELTPGCAARVVRNLWEHIGFVREQLDAWGARTGHTTRLKAYSSHYNISFELRPEEQNEHRNIQKLALLLAYILPIPVALTGCNRRSTGVGVRPRENRIEVTVDFTPDPGLMIATATLVIGVVREILTWPSYELDLLDSLPIPTVKGLVPGKHTTRKGWLTKDFQFEHSPFTSNVDARLFDLRDGRTLSVRAISREIGWYFRESIRKYSDPFSFRLLFSILEGQTPSMLELPDRPAAYEDVGRLCRWGMVLPGLKSVAAKGRWTVVKEAVWTEEGSFQEFQGDRSKERQKFVKRTAAGGAAIVGGVRVKSPQAPLAVRRRGVAADALRRASLPGPGPRSRPVQPPSAPPAGTPPRLRTLVPGFDRRLISPGGAVAKPRGESRVVERRVQERRYTRSQIPFPDRRLSRSAYEQVFLKLTSGAHLKMGDETYVPVGMRGWYHAVFRRASDGKERTLTVDQLLKKMSDWK